MANNIILSICIPTYNRAEYLDETIHSIVNQKRFQKTNDVEIVISDNCSDDNTSEVTEKYIRIYGGKIRYYRNSENTKDSNFEKVLLYGKGVFLKLNNDTLMHHEDTLDIIINMIIQNITNKDILFFSNGVLKNITEYYCEDLNSFIKTISYWSTWIGCFGIWKEDFDSIDNFSRNAKLQLVQTDVLLRLVSSNRSLLVNNIKIFDSVIPKTKGGYNFYEVFVTNYIGLLENYRVNNQISRITLFNEKTKILIYFLIPWTFNIWKSKTNNTFNRKGALSIIFKKYRYHPIFYIGIIYLFFKIVLAQLAKSLNDAQ